MQEELIGLINHGNELVLRLESRTGENNYSSPVISEDSVIKIIGKLRYKIKTEDDLYHKLRTIVKVIHSNMTHIDDLSLNEVEIIYIWACHVDRLLKELDTTILEDMVALKKLLS